MELKTVHLILEFWKSGMIKDCIGVFDTHDDAHLCIKTKFIANELNQECYYTVANVQGIVPEKGDS